MRGRQLQVLRGIALGSLAVFVALCAHIFGGGGMPSVAGIAVPGLLSIVVSILFAGRRLSLPRMMIGVGFSQGIFHLFFTFGAAQMTGGHHDHGGFEFLAVGGQSLAALDGLLMPLSHIVAGAITVASTYFMETALTALLRIADRVRVWLRRFTPQSPTILTTGQAVAPRSVDADLPRILDLFGSLRRRGPPSLLAS